MQFSALAVKPKSKPFTAASELLERCRLENERARIERWNGELPRMIISGKPGTFLSLPNEMRDDK